MPTTEKILFWNAYNIFRGGEREWASQPDKRFAEQANADGGAQFLARVDRLAERVATFSGSATGPAVLGLCELEMSPNTLTAVRDRLNSVLSAGYTLAYREVRSNRAICTALFTRWTVNSTRAIAPKWRVIQVSCTRLGTTIHIFVCHWPSRVSDPLGEQRQVIASIVYDRVVGLGSGARAVVLGDLNDTPSDASVATYLKAGSSTAAAIASTHPNLVLYDCMTAGHLAGGFTHKHEGVERIIDHICTTGTLLTGDPQLQVSSTTIHTSGITQGGQPWRWGDSIAPDGYSDHYPVSINIEWA